MAIDYEYLMGLPPLVVEQHFTARDTILYALGVGAGIAATTTRPECLQFVYEKHLAALPTLPTVLAYPGFWAKDPKYGITWQKLLHRDQWIEIHAEIPIEGSVRGEMKIDGIYDRGADKGALVSFSRRIFNADSGAPIATVGQVNVLRADGGFGGAADQTPPRREVPGRLPDRLVRLATHADQALLYRLCGDLNPLHADPAIAAAAGFERPILHGLASFGVVGLAVVCEVCGFSAAKLRRLEARFSSPVYPGETLEVAIWHEGPGKAAVEASVVERAVKVIGNGRIDYIPIG